MYAFIIAHAVIYIYIYTYLFQNISFTKAYILMWHAYLYKIILV